MSDRSRRRHQTGVEGPGRPAAADVATEDRLLSRLRLLSAGPAGAAMVLVALGWLLHAGAGLPPVWTAAATAVACGLAVYFADRRTAVVAGEAQRLRDADRRAAAAESQWASDHYNSLVGAWLAHFGSLLATGRDEVAWTLKQVEAGERPTCSSGVPEAGQRTGNAFSDLEKLLQEFRREAVQAVVEAAGHRPPTVDAENAEVFVYIARRLHALVSRALAALEAVEKDTEDPDLLHALFGIDHLVTQTRRAVESLGVLGGASPRRVAQPLPLAVVLRQAVAEIEDYARVRVPQPGQDASALALPGYAGPEVIHLLAELVENGTKFSPPDKHVLVRAETVPAGLVVEIEDRGLPMSPEKLAQMNSLLAAPEDVDLRGQLQQGHIGLLVVARLAQRHGIRAELRPNILGGTQALVVVPHSLLVHLPARTEPAMTDAAEPAREPVARPLPPESPNPTGTRSLLHTSISDSPGQTPSLTALPRRISQAASPQPQQESASAPSRAEEAPRADVRPALPRRPKHEEAPPAEAALPAASHEAPVGPATAGFIGSFVAGVRRNATEAGTTSDGEQAPE
jgi:signal transduction histidine kinase